MKKRLLFVICSFAIAALMCFGAVYAADTNNPSFSGETSRTTTQLYPGVTDTTIQTSSSSKYGIQNFRIK